MIYFVLESSFRRCMVMEQIRGRTNAWMSGSIAEVGCSVHEGQEKCAGSRDVPCSA